MITAVVFTSNNARILKIRDESELAGIKVYVLNPDLSAVKSLPPHCWKLEDGVILPKSLSEIQETERTHSLKGVDNLVPVYKTPELGKEFNHLTWIIPLLGILVAISVYIWKH